MGCASGKSNNHLQKRSKRSIQAASYQVKSKNEQQQEIDQTELAYQFLMNLRRHQNIEDQQIIEISDSLDHHHHNLDCLKKCANQRECYLCPQISKPAESSIIRKRQSLLSKTHSDSETHVSERDRCIS